jgi:hypothetical protein
LQPCRTPPPSCSSPARAPGERRGVSPPCADASPPPLQAQS